MNDNIIKMFIGGEEVVSNKEFTINEEMLSASSTILNNCYPASWEETKDYVSNFYYPKDYSKYILGKGNFKYGTDRYTKLNVSGIFPTFETNTEKPFDEIQIDGKSTQATSTQSANLCPPFTDSRWTFTNGASVTSEGYLSIPTTTDARATITIPWNKSRTCYFKDIIVSGGNAHYAGEYFNESGTLLSSNGKATVDKGANYQDETLWGGNNQYGDALTQTTNIKFTIQFSNFTPNPYVIKDLIISENDINYIPFTPNMPSPDYPSEIESVGYENLFNKLMSNYTSFSNTITIDSVSDNSITLTISSTGGPYDTVRYYSVANLVVGKTYTVSANIVGNDNSLIRLVKNNSGWGSDILGYVRNNNSFTFTYDGSYNSLGLFLYISHGVQPTEDLTATFSNIQIEEGSQSHSYIPYGKYGIEVKNIGKNLFDGEYELGSINETTGKSVANNNIIRTKNFQSISPNTNYVISFPAAIRGIMVYFYDSNYSFLGITQVSINTSNSLKYSIFTSLEKAKYIKWRHNTGYTTLENEVQLEKGKTLTEYQPHQSNTLVIELNAPLRSLPNGVKDIAYIKNNILYVDRYVAENNINIISITTLSNGNIGGVARPTGKIKTGSNNLICSNAVVNKTIQDGTCYENPANVVFVGNSTDTLDTIKAKYDGGILYYELAEPYTEKIGEVDTLSTFKGVNNVSLDANMETNMNLTYLWKNYDVLFAGIVKNSGDISLRPTDPKYCSLQILDYKTFLSESDTLDFVISDKTIAEAISMVVDAISGYGFILGTINISQADDVIGAYSTLNKTAYDVFQYLANISGSRWRARFVDSDTMAIDFYDPELLPRANDIDYTQQYWEDNKIVDLTFNYGTRDYRNKQIILSDEVYGGIDYTEVLLSNGYGTSYITQNNIANITSITVNGVKAEVITQSEKDLGVDADFYYTPGKNVVESTTSYSAGTQIIITYTPLVKGRQIVYNDEEVTRIATQTNTTGVISRYENRNDILSSDELENIAETYIKYKGKPEIILKLTTLNNDLFSIGEICYFNSPIADLAQDYMVKSKATNYTSVAGETNIFYTYELTSSFNSEKAINYFDNQRNKTTGNIAEGESITRNIDINNSAMIIWENATITEISVSVDGDNALNSVLNSPFIQ